MQVYSFLLLPTQYSAVATGRIGSREVHRIGAACGRTHTDIAVGAHGHEHELVVQVVLPHEDLGLRLVCSQTDIAGDAVARDKDIASVLTLQDDLALAFVDDAETGLGALVRDLGVVHQSVGQSNHGLAISKVDDTHGLAEGYVAAAVGLRLFNCKIVELCIAAVMAVLIESKEGVARSLERNELIGKRHHASQSLESDSIQRVGILLLIVIVVTNTAKPDFSLRQTDRCNNRCELWFIFALIPKAKKECVGMVISHNAYP